MQFDPVGDCGQSGVSQTCDQNVLNIHCGSQVWRNNEEMRKNERIKTICLI